LIRARRQKVTIQAVAARAGVSAMTVSNVFNRKGKFSERTRQRVLAAIKALGYVPDQTARRLVGAVPARIGLIYVDTDSVFLSTTLAAVSIAVAQKGLQLLLRDARGRSFEDVVREAQSLVQSGADALLMLPPFAEMLSGSNAFAALKVPAVAIATAHALPDMATVRIDNRAAAHAMTEMLLNRGRRKIAFISGPSTHSDSVARLQGHIDALTARRIKYDPQLTVEGLFSFASGLTAAEALLSRSPRPDAIVAANDDMAAAVLWTAHRRGIAVPRDLAVTGFDDTTIATRVWPPLATIRQPIRGMADSAIDLLFEALASDDTDRELDDVVLDFTLVDRASAQATLV
jgi:LacI family transcriptional regulator